MMHHTSDTPSRPYLTAPNQQLLIHEFPTPIRHARTPESGTQRAGAVLMPSGGRHHCRRSQCAATPAERAGICPMPPAPTPQAVQQPTPGHPAQGCPANHAAHAAQLPEVLLHTLQSAQGVPHMLLLLLLLPAADSLPSIGNPAAAAAAAAEEPAVAK
eukprot:388658-Pelagomonas_calceolata.AAC.1